METHGGQIDSSVGGDLEAEKEKLTEARRFGERRAFPPRQEQGVLDLWRLKLDLTPAA